MVSSDQRGIKQNPLLLVRARCQRLRSFTGHRVCSSSQSPKGLGLHCGFPLQGISQDTSLHARERGPESRIQAPIVYLEDTSPG